VDLSSAFGVPEFLASTGAVITARAANETARIAFLSCNFAIEALPDLSRRYAADDSVGCYIAGDHGSGGQNGAVAHLPGITMTAWPIQTSFPIRTRSARRCRKKSWSRCASAV
jgi:hypothetical protein